MTTRQLVVLLVLLAVAGMVATYLIYGTIWATPVFN